jgi:hypothetical protein
MSTDRMLKAALRYGERSWPVLPLHNMVDGRCSCGKTNCPSPAKHPRTANGLKAATTNLVTIEQWWHRWPEANIGLLTGVVGDVLDIDGAKGEASLDTVLSELLEGQLPLGPSAITGGDGRHLFFKPTGLGNRAGVRPGLDWRGKSGYVVAGGSTHASGKQYRWVTDLDTPLPEAPDWLTKLLTQRSERDTVTVERSEPDRNDVDRYLNPEGWGGIVLRDELATLAQVRHGQRNDTLNRCAIKIYGPVKAGHIDKDEATAKLIETAQSLDTDPEHPFTLDEIRNTLDSAYRAAEARGPATKADVATGEITQPSERTLINWSTFWTRDRTAQDWMIEPVVVRKRAHALFAPAKEGKSLVSIEMAAALASGNAVYLHEASGPLNVAYLDYEMTEDDVFERLTDMGYDESYRDLFTEYFHYWLHPTLPPLDTKEGGLEIVEFCRDYNVDLLIIDTTGRAVDGPEDKADTFRAFHKHTGMRLKAAGITWLRSDHSGKDVERGQRGSSSKNDDVDIVWKLTKTDDGFKLTSTHKRLAWIDNVVVLKREFEPLRHEVVKASWASGSAELARVLNELGAPIDITNKAARSVLKEAGRTATGTVLADAIRWRRTLSARSFDDLIPDAEAA